MLHRTIAFLCVAALTCASAQALSSAPDPKHALEGAALAKALHAGGYTLYFRHTATDFAQDDAKMTGYEDCPTQRNLSERGREQAKAIGQAMRTLALPVGEVIASPFCRTMETARLMLGRATASADVRGYVGPPPGRTRDYRKLEKLLATPPKPGSLRVIASHGNPFAAIAGPPHLAEGEAAVIKAMQGRWIVVARIRADDWPNLLAAR